MSRSQGAHLLRLLDDDTGTALPMWARFDVRDSDVCSRRPFPTSTTDAAAAHGTADGRGVSDVSLASSGGIAVGGDGSGSGSGSAVSKESARGAEVLVAAMRKGQKPAVHPSGITDGAAAQVLGSDGRLQGDDDDSEGESGLAARSVPQRDGGGSGGGRSSSAGRSSGSSGSGSSGSGSSGSGSGSSSSGKPSTTKRSGAKPRPLS